MLLGPSTTVLWRALAQSQNHIPGGGPAELTDLLEQYAQTLAQNMKLTYLNPVALVAPNLGELRQKKKRKQQLHCQSHEIFIFMQPIWAPTPHPPPHNAINLCCEIVQNNSL